jgi:hypothetical protein
MVHGTEYSQAVVEGMRQHGISEGDIARIVGLPVSKIRLVMRKKAGLNDKQLDLIEQETGLTAGQLAASTLGDEAKPLQDLMDQWAEAMCPTRLSSKSTSRQPIRVTREKATRSNNR